MEGIARPYSVSLKASASLSASSVVVMASRDHTHHIREGTETRETDSRSQKGSRTIVCDASIELASPAGSLRASRVPLRVPPGQRGKEEGGRGSAPLFSPLLLPRLPVACSPVRQSTCILHLRRGRGRGRALRSLGTTGPRSSPLPPGCTAILPPFSSFFILRNLPIRHRCGRQHS